MSRSGIDSSITAAETATVQNASHQIIVRRDYWSMDAYAGAGNANVDAEVPSSWVMRATGALAYCVSRHTDGSARVRVVNTETTGDYGLSITHSQVSCVTMRPGLVRLANGECWLYAADHGAGGIQLRRAQLTGTANNLSFTLSNHGSAFGPAYEASATRVRRVEACCPTEAGCIVALGVHDFALKLSTVQFWLVDMAGVPWQLDTILQMPLDTVYTQWGSVWYGGAKYCSAIAAMYYSAKNQIQVIANDQTRGRAVTFSIQNGVESNLRPVAEIDPEAELISLMPHSVTLINGLYYLTARYTRRVRVGQSSQESVAFDMALTSRDGRHWSFGEQSCFLAETAHAGALLMRTDSPAYLFYAGNGYAQRAAVTEIQAPASNKRTDLTAWLDGWDVGRVSNNADDLRLTINDEAAAGGASIHAAARLGDFRDGASLLLRTGQAGVLTDYGWYWVQSLPTEHDMAAWGGYDVNGVDLSSGKMINTRALVDLDVRGRQVVENPLQTLDDLTVKTPIFGDDQLDDLQATKTGLVFRGLNSPAVIMAGEAEDNGDVFMELNNVVFSGSSTANCLASIGFVFGATENGKGNIMFAPKASSWSFTGQPTPVTAPAVRTLNLVAVDESDPTKEGTGWNFAEGDNGLWRALLAGNLRTTATPGSYSVNPAFAFAPDTPYDVVFRLSGRRAQLMARVRDYDPADAANNAAYTLVCEFLFDFQAQRAQAGRDSIGFAAAIDVPGSPAWFTQGSVGDLNTQLTDAKNSSSFTRLLGTGQRQHDNGYQVSNVDVSKLRVGMRVYMSSPSSGYGIISSIGASSFVTNHLMIPWDNAGTLVYNYTVQVYGNAAGEDWGYGDSGAVKQTQASGTVETYLNPNARIVPVRAGGRAGFFSRDATAYSPRFVVTNHKRHVLKSGSDFTGGTYEGWDQTAPLESGQVGYSGSKPSDWRIILAGGIVFEDDPVIYGLPAGIAAAAYMRKGAGSQRERVRVVALTVTNRGVYPGDTPVTKTRYCVPAYYTSVADAGENATQLRNWRKGAYQPGDDLGDIPLAPGLQVKVLSAANTTEKPESQIYALETLKASSPTDNNTSIVYLDKPFPGPVSGPRYDPNDANKVIGDGDLLVLDGRGQFGDEERRHREDAPCLFWPGNGATGVQDAIKIGSLRAYTGNLLPAEDAIRRFCVMAGMHDAEFRNMHASPAAAAAVTLSTSFQDLPLQQPLANFMLDARVHIGGNNTSSGGITTTRRLYIRFRGYYQLAIWQQATAAEYAANSAGRIVVGLATTSTDISVPASGDLRWLALSPAISIAAGQNLAGTVSGSNPTYTLTEDVSRLVDLRVGVNGHLVTVEIGGKHVWTFDLNQFTNGTVSYRSDAPAAISVAYSSTVPSYTSSWRVLELGEEITPRYTLREGQTASSAVGGVASGRHIKWFATPAGGTRFTRAIVRDDLGTITENVSGQAFTPAGEQAGLQAVQGQSYGAYLNGAVIRQAGFSMALSRTDFAPTPELADLEAWLLARQAAEFAEPREFRAVGILRADPEDRLTLQFSNAGDRPAQAAVGLVITRFSLSTTQNLRMVQGVYTVRKYIP